MDETSRSRRLQLNEQVKAVSTVAGNGGLLLVAAAAARWLIEGLDEHAML